MNLALLDPGHDLPDTLDSGAMSIGMASTAAKSFKKAVPRGAADCCAFSRHGNYLAVGCQDGACIVFDFVTRTPARVLHAHTRATTSTCWSRGCALLVTASLDKTLKIWQTAAEEWEEPLQTVVFDEAVQLVQVCPRRRRDADTAVAAAAAVTAGAESAAATAATTAAEATAVSDDDNSVPPLPSMLLLVCLFSSDAPQLVESLDGASHALLPLAPVAAGDAGRSRPKTGIWSVATFDQTGDVVVAGSSQGVLHVVNTSVLAAAAAARGAAGRGAPPLHGASVAPMVMRSFRVQGGAAVQLIKVAPNNEHFICMSADSTVRLFSLDAAAGAPLQEFKDLVNRNRWQRVAWSPDSEYCVGATMEHSGHAIHIWSKDGRLVKCLHGPRESLLDLAWHPLRPFLATCTIDGHVHVWGTDISESWSAFAPNFEELDANEEYVEREDEFDIKDEEELGKMQRARIAAEETAEIDIISVDHVAALGSDSEDCEPPLDSHKQPGVNACSTLSAGSLE